MDERLRFIARLLDGEKMAVLCREFGVSRKTGYKILTRYNEIGLEGLTDRSRRPYRHANQLPLQIETRIVRLKQDKPSLVCNDNFYGRAATISLTCHCRRRMRRFARSAAVTSRLVRSRLKASGSKRPPHQVNVSRCSGWPGSVMISRKLA